MFGCVKLFLVGALHKASHCLFI